MAAQQSFDLSLPFGATGSAYLEHFNGSSVANSKMAAVGQD